MYLIDLWHIHYGSSLINSLFIRFSSTSSLLFYFIFLHNFINKYKKRTSLLPFKIIVIVSYCVLFAEGVDTWKLWKYYAVEQEGMIFSIEFKWWRGQMWQCIITSSSNEWWMRGGNKESKISWILQCILLSANSSKLPPSLYPLLPFHHQCI